MSVPGLRWNDSGKEATDSRLACCFHLHPTPRHPVGAGNGSHTGELRCALTAASMASATACSGSVSADRKGLWQPGLGEEQVQPSDDCEVHGCGRNRPATAPCVSGGPVGFCVVCLSQPTPWLPTEPHRQAGEVNFQQPPEFLLTFLGVFVI